MSQFRVVFYPSSAGLGLLLLLLAWGAGRVPSFGQVAQEPKDTERAARMRVMRELVQEMDVSKITDRGHVRTKLVEEPLTRFSDPSRMHLDGTLWVWGPVGRPVAIMELYANSGGGASWIHVIQSLCDGPVTAVVEGTALWHPPRCGLQMTTFPDAPAPATGKRARLRQMKSLARRLSAHEFWDPNNQRTELRLLPQPLHRYSDPQTGLLDGVIFALVQGIDLEVVVLIELWQKSGAEAHWQYGLARLGHAELHVLLDDKEVWQQHRVAETAPDDSYFLFIRNAPWDK